MTKEKPPHKLNAGALINLYRAFGAHLRPHRWFMLSATLCMVLAAGIEILKPWPMKVIFDGILLKNTGADLDSRISCHSSASVSSHRSGSGSTAISSVSRWAFTMNARPAIL
jgi:hypothetical protein